MSSLDTLIDALNANGHKIKRAGDRIVTTCPAHPDRNPSFSAAWSKGKTLVHCFAGCTAEDITTSLGLTMGDLHDEQTSNTTSNIINLDRYRFNPEHPAGTNTIPTPQPQLQQDNDGECLEWIYQDENRQPYLRVTKQRLPDGSKTFRQQHWDGFGWTSGLGGKQPILYRLPEIIDMCARGGAIAICEGEKDADTFNRINTNPDITATTAPMGAGKWRDEYTQTLTGACAIYIIHDNDDPGLKHATKIVEQLEAAEIPYSVLAPATGKDLTDHINAGLSIDQLIDHRQHIEQAKAAAAEARLAKAIDEERIRQTARDTVKKDLANEHAAGRYALPTYTATLRHELAITDQPLQWVINGLWPQDANISLTAPFKGGKTSTANSVIRALADQQPLFANPDFNVNHTGRIAIWNYEVSPNQYRTWLRDINIQNLDAITVLNMRGHTWPIIHQYVIDHTIQWLADNNIETWIIDPLARAFVGCGDENSNADMGVFCDTLDYIKDQAGVRNLMVIAHTGRNSESGVSRARGASRFDDWADARWTLTKDAEGQRWFTADGRDVSIDESRLDWDNDTRTQSIKVGIGRKQNTMELTAERVLQIITNAGQTGIHRQGIINTYKSAYGEESLSNESSDSGILGKLQKDGHIYKEKIGTSLVFKATHNQYQFNPTT